MRCDSVQEQIIHLIRAELSEEEETRVANHLHDCDLCQFERDRVEQTLLMIRSVTEVQTSESGWDNLAQRIHAEPPLEASESARVHRFAKLFALAAAITAVLILAGLLFYHRDGSFAGKRGLAFQVTAGKLEHSEYGLVESGQIYNNQSLRNPSDQVTEFQLAGIGTFYLDSQSAIRIDDNAILHLEQGHAQLEATTIQPGEDPIIVATPHAQAKILGTKLDIRNDGQATTLTVLEGQVEFRTPTGTQTVSSGSQSVASLGARPTAPQQVADLWRYRNWTSIQAVMTVSPQTIQTNEHIELHLQIVNRYSAPISIVPCNMPHFDVTYQYGESHLRSARWTPNSRDASPSSFNLDGSLTLNPGEAYQIWREIDDFNEPGLYRIRAVYQNGREGAVSSQAKLWRGILIVDADLWVTDDQSRTAVILGPFPDGPETTRTIKISPVPLPSAIQLQTQFEEQRDDLIPDLLEIAKGPAPAKNVASFITEKLDSDSPITPETIHFFSQNR